MLNLNPEEKKMMASIINKIMYSDNIMSGCYDAKHGNEHYMYGISAAMEFFAYNVSTTLGDFVNEKFIKNMIASEKKAIDKVTDK